MEVKPGYKQTEVGIIPQDWRLVSVRKLVEEKTLEKPIDGNHGNIHPKSSDYVDHGIPFVMANNFEDGAWQNQDRNL
jgi:type I restriction enzyme S subunit